MSRAFQILQIGDFIENQIPKKKKEIREFSELRQIVVCCQTVTARECVTFKVERSKFAIEKHEQISSFYKKLGQNHIEFGKPYR